MSGAIPLPRPTPLSQPHWDGCREGKLRVQRCDACHHYVFIPQLLCPRCLGTGLSWMDTSGLGTVYSFTIVHRPQRPEFAVPYVVAIVELDEGFHMLTNLVECRPEDVEVGLPVVVHFQRMSDAITLPYFKPRRARSL